MMEVMHRLVVLTANIVKVAIVVDKIELKGASKVLAAHLRRLTGRRAASASR